MNYLHSSSIRLKTKGRLSVNYWTFFGLCLHTSPLCHKLFQSFSDSPDLSVLSDWLHCDRHISHSQRGKRHADRGLCPEIKQYAVREKNNNKKTTNKQTTRIYLLLHACPHGSPIVTSRQKRQTTVTESSRLSMWRARAQNLGTIWALQC